MVGDVGLIAVTMSEGGWRELSGGQFDMPGQDLTKPADAPHNESSQGFSCQTKSARRTC